jgi:predicted KAP-like P-loop ATPase
MELVSKVLGRFVSWLVKEKDLADLKDEADKLLRIHMQKFIIFVDDIDRLTIAEIRDLFKVIKGIANLPNIIYILAFDKERIADALKELGGGSGKEYLEKIVQLPFDLPLPDKASISHLLFERLDKALGPLNDSDFDEQRWANIYLDGIDPLINTPRDITRLCNAITVTFPAVHGEVNVVDFIAIEAIRVFTPEIYELIRSNSDEFTGTSERESSSNKETKKKFHQSYLDNIDTELQKPMKLLLQRLFPKLESVWGNLHYGADTERTWRRQLQVCSKEVFPVYFRLQLAEGDIGASDMRRFLDISSDKAEIVKYLRMLISQKHKTGITRARALLERLEDYTEKDIPEKNVKPILLALFDMGDELRATEPDRLKMYDFGVEMQVARIVYQLLKRISEEDRFDLMKTAINEGKGVVTFNYEVSLLDERAEKTKESKNLSKDDILLPSGKVEELKNLAVDRITNESEKSSLLKCVKLSFILYCWKMWDKSNKYQEWVNRMKSHRDFIVPLLTSSLGVTFSAGMGFFSLGDRVAKRKYRVDLNFIKEFVELSEIKPIVESALREGKLSDRERLALDTFLKELERPKDDRGEKVDEKED